MFTTGSKWFFGLGARRRSCSRPPTAGAPAAPGSARSPPATTAASATTSATRSWSPSGVAAVFLGLVALADPRRQPERAGPAGRHRRGARRPSPPAHLAYWPVVGAFGAALVVLGLVDQQRALHRRLLRPPRRARRVDGAGLVRPGHRRPRDQPARARPAHGALRGAARRLPHRRRHASPPSPALLLTSSELGAVVGRPPSLGVVILGVGVAPRHPPEAVAATSSPASSPSPPLGVVTAGVVVGGPGRAHDRAAHARSTSRGRPRSEGTGLEPQHPRRAPSAATTTTVAEGEG